MNNVSLSNSLRLLANGINPETGYLLPGRMKLHETLYQSFLFSLAEELDNINLNLTPEEHWNEGEVDQLQVEWYDDLLPLEEIAQNHKRSILDVALKLITSNLAKADDVLPGLPISELVIARDCMIKSCSCTPATETQRTCSNNDK